MAAARSGDSELPASRALGFYAIVGAATLGGAALALTNIDPIAMLFWTAVINGVVAVPIMAAMMVMPNMPAANFALPPPPRMPANAFVDRRPVQAADRADRRWGARFAVRGGVARLKRFTRDSVTRIIVSGGPHLGTGSFADRRECFRTRFDHFRSAVVNTVILPVELGWSNRCPW